MSHSTITRDADGDVTITRSDDGALSAPPPPGSHGGVPVVIHSPPPDGFYYEDSKPFDGGLLVAGIFLGMLLLFIMQSAMKVYARRAARRQRDIASIGPQEDRMAAEVAALARRTATLETIVTDPAQRTLRDIEALR